VPCGFLHLPYLPEQIAELLARHHEGRRTEPHQRSDLASMHVETIVEGVRLALETCARSMPR
jgi:pyroglutamyl-peptidase